ncbi:MAG: addiction module protein [Opitutales bacterium]|nr:addiction module protein [Opitutales bacterium]
MTREEKIAAMEALWADLSRTPELVESPHWHEEALAQAEASLKEGTAQFRPLSEVKKRISEAIS